MENIKIKIEMENGDIMEGELYPDIAPITVENFVKLIQNKFFDGLIFHRVIKGFMIQGGGYDQEMNQRITPSIKGEFESNGIQNNIKHEKGVLSMARTMVKDSASSQFFIMHEAAPHLDGEYAAFGKITKGLDVVDRIASCDTNVNDQPIQAQIIQTICLI